MKCDYALSAAAAWSAIEREVGVRWCSECKRFRIRLCSIIEKRRIEQGQKRAASRRRNRENS